MTANSSSIPKRDLTTDTGAIQRALREAIVTMFAILATLGCALAIDPEPGPCILAVVLCLSFSRSHLDRDLRGRLEAALVLPVVGLVATGAGLLLLHQPWIGAAVFVTGMFVSIWLRRFGPLARRTGSLIALPFVVILITPYVPNRHAGQLLALLMPVIVALLALLWVAGLQILGRRVRMLPPACEAPVRAIAAAARSSQRPLASTRMAIQMAMALGASFLVGYVFFSERWGWIVLTAFIVNSGNRGRLDVAYKSVLRVLGAAVGTLAALLVTVQVGGHDASTVVLILVAVFLGIWLRPLGYAWWALFITIALALLQGFEGGSAHHILALRMEEIVIGAILGVASAWLIFPVRSTAVLRRRLADALAILADAFDPATPSRSSQGFSMALNQVQEVAPAFRAARFVTRCVRSRQPADWVDAIFACHSPASRLIGRGETPAAVRKAIGDARKALREPDALKSALLQLRQTLVELSEDSRAAVRN